MATALIVDDTKTELSILTDCLEGAGIKVDTASSGEEALEKINRNPPNIIILDVVLPGKSGFEVCREVKQDAKTQNIPIIICSTKGTDMDKFWGKKQGADAYIPKPVDREELIRTVKLLINA
jgi:two-component system, chemotaxis family, response regulator PixH